MKMVSSVKFPLLSVLSGILVFFLCAISVHAQSQVEQESTAPVLGPKPAWEVLETTPSNGEQCLVCGGPVPEEMNSVALRYKGRQFYVGEPLMEDFEADPEKYLAKIQPRSALFDESQMTPEPLADGWLFFGLYALFGLLFGGASAYTAVHKGRHAVRWFFIGLSSNVVGFIAAKLSSDLAHERASMGVPSGLRKVPLTHHPVDCPDCGNHNHPSARECGGCGRELSPEMEGEVRRV